MPRVYLPSTLDDLTDGRREFELPGRSVRAAVRELDQQVPGAAERLCPGGELQPGLSVVVNGSVSSLGLLQPVEPTDEVHFLPAIGGG